MHGENLTNNLEEGDCLYLGSLMKSSWLPNVYWLHNMKLPLLRVSVFDIYAAYSVYMNTHVSLFVWFTLKNLLLFVTPGFIFAS